MCRLFGVISSSQIDADYLLRTAPKSLLYQSRADRRHPQADGWGIGWFERGKPKIVKSPRPIYQDLRPKSDVRSPTLDFGLRTLSSTCLIGHVRWASNPLKLAKHHLIGLEHTQPFSFGRWLFAHNGTLLIPKEVRQALGPLEKHIRGNNDSEVLFYWLMKYLRLTPTPLPKGEGGASPGEAQHIVSAIRNSLRALDLIWKQCRKKYPLYKHPYHGLNWVLTDGKILVAMCYVNPGGFGKAKALCKHGEPYYQLRYKWDSEGWIVASEPLDHDPRWKPVPHGRILVANAWSGRFWPIKGEKSR